jgi:hypothetical protein
MNFFKFLGIIALLATIAAPVQAAWWKPILVCDGGAAVVDLDLGERRNVQLVINNKQIVEYFALNRGMQSSMNFSNGKIIVSAGLNQGIQYSGQFHGFDSNAANAPAVQVSRDEFGLKVRLVSLAHKECIDWRANDFYCAETRDVPEVQYADWYFRSCAEQPANP